MYATFKVLSLALGWGCTGFAGARFRDSGMSRLLGKRISLLHLVLHVMVSIEHQDPWDQHLNSQNCLFAQARRTNAELGFEVYKLNCTIKTRGL